MNALLIKTSVCKLLVTILLTVFWSCGSATTIRVPKTGRPANSYTLKAGDSLLFERGGKWNLANQISVFCNGAKPEDIYIGSYGVGNRPVFTTRTAVPGWNDPAKWVKVRGDSVWKMKMQLAYSYRIYLNGQQGDRAYLNYQGPPVDRIVDSVNRFHNYACDETVEYAIYVYAPGRNPATYYSNIEYVGAPSATLEISGSGFTMEGLDVQGGAGASVFCILVSQFVIRENRIGLDASHSGLSFSGARFGLIERNEIESGDRKKDRHLFQHGVGDGLYMTAGIHNVNVRWNYIHDWGHSCFELDTKGSAIQPGYYHKGLLLSNLNVYENLLKAANVDYCRGAEFNVDTAVANRKMAKGTVRFYRNYIDSTHVQSQFACEGMLIAGNVFKHTFNPTNLEYANHDNGFALAIGTYNMTTGKRMLIANNTFAFNESGAIKLGSNDAASYDTLTGNIIVNNIFYRNGENCHRETTMGHVDGVQLMVENYGKNPAKLGAHTIKNNLFLSHLPANVYFDNRYGYPNTNKDVDFLNSRVGKDKVWDVTCNIYADPQFVNATAGDFFVKKGSPAEGKGLNLRGYGQSDELINGSEQASASRKASTSPLSIGAPVQEFKKRMFSQISLKQK